MISQVLEGHVGTTLKPNKDVIVRAATEADIEAIVAVVNENVRQGHLLPRTPENIRASLNTWLVAEVDGQVVGIGSLLKMSDVLVEVRSLAVLPAFRSYGVGAKIVQGLVEEARRRGFRTAFALTRAVHFFEKLGFTVTNKERFPEKVWTDCAICPLRHACDETAVVLELGR
ncbi:MAG TPA: GNAT family N-acetyltransferase [Roseiflexaceae bacterium]|nr:GNAT family N-acetyltransferase [Roseiflexaceae bacterium]